MTSLADELENLVLYDGLTAAQIRKVVICWAIEIGTRDVSDLVEADLGQIAHAYRVWAAPYFAQWKT